MNEIDFKREVLRRLVPAYLTPTDLVALKMALEIILNAPGFEDMDTPVGAAYSVVLDRLLCHESIVAELLNLCLEGKQYDYDHRT